MSVHGEYSRALETMLVSLRRLEEEGAKEWTEALLRARVDGGLDLSTAARDCLLVLESIDATRDLSSPAGIGSETDPLREPFQHLLLHCRSVLGSSDWPIED